MKGIIAGDGPTRATAGAVRSFMTGALCLSLLTACATPQPLDLVKSIVERDRSTCSCTTTGAGYGCACTPLPECGPSLEDDE